MRRDDFPSPIAAGDDRKGESPPDEIDPVPFDIQIELIPAVAAMLRPDSWTGAGRLEQRAGDGFGGRIINWDGDHIRIPAAHWRRLRSRQGGIAVPLVGEWCVLKPTIGDAAGRTQMIHGEPQNE